MRLIYHIEVKELNKKAADLAPFLKMYKGCLMSAAQMADFIEQVKKLCADLNARYPRIKPFEVHRWKGGDAYCVSVMIEGTDKCVAHIRAALWRLFGTPRRGLRLLRSTRLRRLTRITNEVMDKKDIEKKVAQISAAVAEAGGGVFIAIIPERGSCEPVFRIKGRALELVQAVACAMLNDKETQLVVDEALKQVRKYEKKFCKDDTQRDA